MKKLLIIIALASCKKQPIKECWTIQSYKVVQVVPSVYEVTLTFQNQTKVIRQSSIPIVGANTCENKPIIQDAGFSQIK